MELSNYRPISVLFFSSKVYEKLMYNSLYPILIKGIIIPFIKINLFVFVKDILVTMLLLLWLTK